MYKNILFRTKYTIKTIVARLKEYLLAKNLDIDYDTSILFMLACDYNNIGDVFIRIAQEEYLKKIFPDKNIVTISYSDTYKYMKSIQRNSTVNTIITLTGGGDTDDLYTGLEIARNTIIQRLKNSSCKIVGFPQTIDYSKTKRGNYYLKKTCRAYSNNPNFVFTAREKMSLESARIFKKTKLILTPDIVMSLDYSNRHLKRSGIGMLLRSDEEKKLSAEFQTEMIKQLKMNYEVSVNDMTVNQFDSSLLYQYAEEKANYVLGKEVVITDRLHGMILCYITNTPCIVFKSSNHKITEVYKNWLKDNQNFVVLLETKDIDEVLGEIDRMKNIACKKKDLTSSFMPLMDALIN